MQNNRGVELEKIAQECDNDPDLMEEAKDNKRLSREIRSNKGMSKLHRRLIVNDAQIQMRQQFYVPQKTR